MNGSLREQTQVVAQTKATDESFAMQGRSDTGQMKNTEQGCVQKAIVLDTNGRTKTSLQIPTIQI